VADSTVAPEAQPTNQERNASSCPSDSARSSSTRYALTISPASGPLLERPVNDGANQFFAMIPASPDGSFPALMFLAVPEPRHGKCLDVDGIDRKILAHLQTDGRITLTELADRVSLSITRCQRRVRDLEASGAIRGYRAVVDPAAVGLGFEVLVFATVVRPEAVTSMQPWPISRKSSKPNGSSATPTT
jgi:hypothetical protein